MAQSFDIVFAFKKQFEPEIAAKTISVLRHHPKIWELISQESTYLRIDKFLKENSDIWSIQGVVRFICSQIHDSTEIDNPEKLTESIEKIASSVFEIEKLLSNHSWQVIIKELSLSRTDINEIRDLWGTVFTYFINSHYLAIELEQALFDENAYTMQILAHLIKIQTISDLSEFVDRHAEQLKKEPEKVAAFADALRQSGAAGIAENLVRTYLEQFGRKEMVDQNADLQDQRDTELSISRFISISGLAESIGNQTQSIFFRRKAQDLLEKKLDSVKLMASFDMSLLEKATAIKDADRKAAQDYCKLWLSDYLSATSHSSSTISNYSEIERSVNLFTDLDLLFEAVEFLENVSKTYGKNEQIEMMIGDICSSAGDQARTIRYFKPLFGEDKLSRSQTIELANAFVYTKNWTSAAEVLSTINILTVSEAFLKILCIQQEDPQTDLQNRVSGLAKVFSGSKAVDLLAQALNGISINTPDMDGVSNEEMNLMVELLVGHLTSSNRINLFTFLAESKNLSDNAGYQYYLAFSESLPHSETDALLHDLFLKRDFNHQEIFENVVFQFYKRGLFQHCEELLLKHHHKWLLSQKLIQIEVGAALENKDYNKANSLLDKLVKFFAIDNDTVTLFGIAALRSTFNDFPYSYSQKVVTEHEKGQFKELFDDLQEEQIIGANQILKIEILSDQKTRDYLALGVNYSENQVDESWRIPFAIGCHYFKEQKYDQAIIYLSQSRKISRKSSAALKLLVEAYNNLKLYDEAAELIRDEFTQNHISLSDLKLYINSLFNSKSLWDFLSEDQRNPEDQILFTLLRVRILLMRGLGEKAIELLNQTERKIPFHDICLLEVGDLFRLAGQEQEMKRVLDKFLSNNQNLDDRTIILVSGLFFQAGFFEKSLNILSLINLSDINTGIARAANLIKLDEFMQARDAVLEAISQPEKQSLKQIAGPADVPQEWSLIDLDFLVKVIIDQIHEKQRDTLQNLFSYLIDQSAIDYRSYDIACDVAEITGNAEFYQLCSISGISASEGFSKRSRLMKLSNALSNDYEIEAAILADEISKEDPNDPIGKLLQARFRLRQGEETTAKLEIQQLHHDFIVQQQRFKAEGSIIKLKNLVAAIHLCNAMQEMANYRDAYELAKWIILEIGFNNRFSDSYFEMLYETLKENQIDDLLQIKNHSFRFDEVDRAIFSKYLDQIGLNKLNEERITEIRLFFNEKNHPIPEMIKIAELDQSRKLLNDYTDLENGEVNTLSEKESISTLRLQNYSQAVLELQKDPARSCDLFKNLLREDPNNPRYLFALGMALKVIGDNQGSYPLINLALEIWPNEFEWQRIAADLCELLGDNLNAARHRHAIAMYISAGSGLLQSAGAGQRQELIEEFIRNTKHIPHRKIPELLKYARESLGWGDLPTANEIISRIKEISPSNIDTRLLFSEILLKNRQFTEAEGEIRLIMRDQPLSAEAIVLLTRLNIERGNTSEALQIIDEALHKGVIREDEFLTLKVEALEKENGSKEAIAFLRNYCNDHHDSTILRKAARFMLDHGEVKTAENYIELLIGSDSEDAENLLLAGLLSSTQGDLDKALHFFNLLITKYPFRDEGYIHCAKIFEIKRQFEFAQNILEEGVKNNPDSFSLLKFIGLFLFNAGKTDLAKGYLERAYTMNRNDLEIKELQ